MTSLDSVDLDAKLSKDKYERQLEELQFQMLRLQRANYQIGHRVVCVFEGWDAGGKGGAIKRLTGTLDPRGFIVHAIGAPTSEEKAHNYLWRFWRLMPRDGQIVIFDRSWYGRVMVERVEGYATTHEWQQAYAEINDFERILSHDRTTVLKFFIHISKAEQLERFEKRAKDPYKTWKLTADDWRNREKWDVYYTAINDMLERTSTEHAPWHVIAGNNKRWARIAVLRTVVETLEKDLPFSVDKRGLLILDEELAARRVEEGRLNPKALEAVLEEQKKIATLLQQQA